MEDAINFMIWGCKEGYVPVGNGYDKWQKMNMQPNPNDPASPYEEYIGEIYTASDLYNHYQKEKIK